MSGLYNIKLVVPIIQHYRLFGEQIVQQKCRKCRTNGFFWYEQAPESKHQFKVICRQCGTFLKWESERHLNEADRDPNTTIIPYEAPPTLDKFRK